MDGSRAGWYFLTMPVKSTPRDRSVRSVDFHVSKYGRPLLVDAALISDMPAFDSSPRPYRITFYDILLVTKGQGTFALDDMAHAVAPGVVLFTRPGEVRQWRVEGLEGACLFFAPDFIQEVFSDPRFVETFSFFRAGRPSAALRLSLRQKTEFLRRFAAMRREIVKLKGDASHLLRARLYELMVLLNRWYVRRHGEVNQPTNNAAARFMALVERNFRKQRRVGAYASAVGLTPGHLSALCRKSLGVTAGAAILRRLALEAKRLLLFTSGTAAEVGYALGFNDPAYFSRFFRRQTGLSPRQYREAGLSSPPSRARRRATI